MKIKINSNRYQQLMAFLDKKFPAPEQNSGLRQRLKDIGLCESTLNKDNLTNRQVDVLEYLIAADRHLTTKYALYFNVFGLYNDNAQCVRMKPEYEADLKKLESLKIITNQGAYITLATPATKIQQQATPENEEKAEAPNTVSDYHLRKRKNTSSTTQQSDNLKKPRTDTPHASTIETLTTTIKVIQENQALLLSNHENLIAAMTQQKAAHKTLQTSHDDLQTRFNQLEEKYNNQNNTSAELAPFYGRTGSPLFFCSPINLSRASTTLDLFILDNEIPLITQDNSGGGFTL
jgi:hypothetical protein